MRNDTRDVELSDDTMGVPIIVKLPVCMPTVQASVRASGGVSKAITVPFTVSWRTGSVPIAAGSTGNCLN